MVFFANIACFVAEMGMQINFFPVWPSQHGFCFQTIRVLFILLCFAESLLWYIFRTILFYFWAFPRPISSCIFCFAWKGVLESIFYRHISQCFSRRKLKFNWVSLGVTICDSETIVPDSEIIETILYFRLFSRAVVLFWMCIHLFCCCKADGECFNRALRKLLIFRLYQVSSINFIMCVLFFFP